MLRHLFASPFRIFFVSCAAWAVIVVAVWLAIVTGTWHPPLGLHPLQWHQHEMLFGFLNPAVAGFLLTAVCAWTNTVRLHGLPLLLLWLVWLVGRVTALLGAELPPGVVIATNLAFLPLVALDAGWRIWRTREQRQLVIMVVVGLLWLAQLGLLLTPVRDYSSAALVVAAALMLIVGGRITPAFTRSWLNARQRSTRVTSYNWLEAATLASAALLLAALLLGDAVIAGVLAIIATFTTGIRTLLWRGWQVRDEPMLWTLHLALLWIPVGFALLAATCLLGWPASAWKHAIGFGAMGSLILTVMARVALGHTGRPIVFPPAMLAAWLLLCAGAAIRIASALGWLPWLTGITVAAVAWMVAFAVFLWRYTVILSTPRPDGKAG